MIVLRDKPGQLGNRLWSLLPFLLLSEKRKICLFAPYHLSGYSDYFQSRDTKSFIYLWVGFPHLHRLLSKCFRILELLLRKLNQYGFSLFCIWVEPEKHNIEKVMQLSCRKVVFVNSWDYVFDIPESVLTGGVALIHEKLYPKSEVVKKVTPVLLQIPHGKVIVGVHIRLSDYKNYRGGIYYYTISVYYRKMESLAVQFKQKNKEVVFVICSDESFEKSVFEGLETVSISNTTAIDDMYALSKCHFIMGAPSSFSCWASYMGKVPLRFIYNEADDVKIDEFSRIVAFMKFENGVVHIPGQLEYVSNNRSE